jgi:hypothetical protein
MGSSFSKPVLSYVYKDPETDLSGVLDTARASKKAGLFIWIRSCIRMDIHLSFWTQTQVVTLQFGKNINENL